MFFSLFFFIWNFIINYAISALSYKNIYTIIYKNHQIIIN